MWTTRLPSTDVAHLFLRCKEVRSVWKDMKLEKERNDLCLCPDAKSVVHHILLLGEEKSSLIACLLWNWWTRRSKLNANEAACSTERLSAQVRYWAGKSAQYCGKQKKEKNETVEQKWQVPSGDTLKINCDGAFNADTKSGGWGYLVRDQYGNVRVQGQDQSSRPLVQRRLKFLHARQQRKQQQTGE
jgi:hypothetical protein